MFHTFSDLLRFITRLLLPNIGQVISKLAFESILQNLLGTSSLDIIDSLIAKHQEIPKSSLEATAYIIIVICRNVLTSNPVLLWYVLNSPILLTISS